MLWHAYVDESGDRGWTLPPPNLPPGKKMGSSRVFSATAILVPDGAQPAALRAWDAATLASGRPLGTPIHWHDVNGGGARKFFTKTVAEIPGIQVISVVLCKHHLRNVTALKNPGYLYNWTLRFLIERISWFGQQHGAEVAMTFSQVKGLPPKVLLAYLDRIKALGYGPNPATYIQWDHLRMPPRIDTPKNRRMLQLADAASASVFAAFEKDAFGFAEGVYLDLLKPVLWCRPHRRLNDDGLKFGPWQKGDPAPSPPCDSEHPWLPDFCSQYRECPGQRPFSPYPFLNFVVPLGTIWGGFRGPVSRV